MVSSNIFFSTYLAISPSANNLPDLIAIHKGFECCHLSVDVTATKILRSTQIMLEYTKKTIDVTICDWIFHALNCQVSDIKGK